MKRLGMEELTARHRMKILKYLWRRYPQARPEYLKVIEDPSASNDMVKMWMEKLFRKIDEIHARYCVLPQDCQLHIFPEERPRRVVFRWKESVKCPEIFVLTVHFRVNKK